MEENNNTIATVEAPVNPASEQKTVDAAPKKKKVTRSRKKVVAPVEEPQQEATTENNVEETNPQVNNPKAEKGNKTQHNAKEKANAKRQQETAVPQAESSEAEPKAENAPQQTNERPAATPNERQPQGNERQPQGNERQAQPSERTQQPQPQPKPIPRMPSNLLIRDFCDLANSASRIPLLNDQQIQQLTYEEAVQRNLILEAVLSNVLDYDIVLSDTNIWLELLVGHTSSHSDPRVNARLMFERQLEFISRMAKKIGGKFMIMSETYEEVDRFATMQEPTDYKVADWKDEALCRNVAARLAKRLMLSQQKENRLRIEGIGSESHHAAFADPAIIRRTVELFAQGRKVLLLTNDASVAIRSLGMCDDLQRTNNISDAEWREVYEPQRPMVLTMDDLKLLDQFTRQYHYLMVAAGRQWMQDVQMREPAQIEKPLELWMEGFRPGDRHERRSDRLEQERQRKEQERQEQERQRKEQQRLEDERRAAEKQARREEQERREQENRERKEQARLEQQRREEQRRADRERAAAEKAARQAAEEERRRNNENAEEAAAPAEAPAPSPAVEAAPAEPMTQAETAPVEAESAPVATETPAEQPTEAAEQTSAEAAATAIALPPLSPEMMELMGPQKKKPTRRGGRRRKSNEQD